MEKTHEKTVTNGKIAGHRILKDEAFKCFPYLPFRYIQIPQYKINFLKLRILKH